MPIFHWINFFFCKNSLNQYVLSLLISVDVISCNFANLLFLHLSLLSARLLTSTHSFTFSCIFKKGLLGHAIMLLPLKIVNWLCDLSELCKKSVKQLYMAISAMFMYINNGGGDDDDDDCYTLSSFSLAISHNVICMNSCMDVCMPNLHINNFLHRTLSTHHINTQNARR